jgi:ribulose-5-phosphate 4-epimerase/fuculose-1-phosphate aldolase
MIQDADIQNYIRFSRLVGSYKELVQGSGGNISVKSDSQICIKSSGKLLAETTFNSGYTICDINILRRQMEESTDSTSLSICGGEPNSTPSMEVFFHLIPYKWVVHVHPTFLLFHLCQKSWKNIVYGATTLHIPYQTPGIGLAQDIFKMYTGEQVIVLQNHGVIIAAETLEEICEILDCMYQEYHSHRMKSMRALALLGAWNIQKHILKKTGKDMFLKPCHMIQHLNDRFFMPITPDISLFLKNFPLVQEYSAESVVELFDTYITKFCTTPNVLRIFGRIYVLGNTLKHAQCIEEILVSYLEIVSYTDPARLIFFNAQTMEELVNSEKEKHRLKSL